MQHGIYHNFLTEPKDSRRWAVAASCYGCDFEHQSKDLKQQMEDVLQFGFSIDTVVDQLEQNC